MAPALPLFALLSQALVAFTIEFDNEFEHRMPHRTKNYGSAGAGPWLVSMAMWFTCMRFVTEDGISAGELKRQAGVDTNLNGMERWSYITIDAPGLPGRAKRVRADSIIRPTPNGRIAQETWRHLFGVIEGRWRERFGESEVEELRRALCAVIDRVDLKLPDCLPILSYGLFNKLTAPGSAPDQDSGPGEMALCLPVLLSKVLLAFAMEFERDSAISLAISADVLRILTGQNADDVMLLRDLPGKAGVSKEAIAMAVSFLEKRGYAVSKTRAHPPKAKTLRLTTKGRAASESCSQRVRDVEENWRKRFGREALVRLRTALEILSGNNASELSPLLRGIEPYPDGWRASLPGPAVLPHFPMILHRGGFPDGS